MQAQQDGLLRIFWPSDIPKSNHPGVIVGWRNSELDVLVVAVFEELEVRKQNVRYTFYWLIREGAIG